MTFLKCLSVDPKLNRKNEKNFIRLGRERFLALQNTKMSSANKTCEGKQNPLKLAIGRICLVRIKFGYSPTENLFSNTKK